MGETLRILLIEDDQVLGTAIRDHIASNGHGVDWVQRIDDARLALATVGYELIVSATPGPYGFGLEDFRKRHGMRSSTAL